VVHDRIHHFVYFAVRFWIVSVHTEFLYICGPEQLQITCNIYGSAVSPGNRG